MHEFLRWKRELSPRLFSRRLEEWALRSEAQRLVKILAQRMEVATGQRYSDAVSFIRKRLRFELLKTTVIALRGTGAQEQEH